MAVLKAVEQQKHPIHLPYLLTILGPDFAERSVRRWLNECVLEGLIEKTGHKRGTRYQIIANTNISSSAEKTFQLNKHDPDIWAHINKPLFQRNPVTYNKLWIESYQPNFTFYLSEEERNNLKNAGQPAERQAQAGTYARKIYDRLLVELSYNSSRLEGNTYSLGETEKLIREGVDSVGKLDIEKIMILNHKEAIRYLVDNSHKLEINFNTICTLHYLLSDGLILAKDAGKLRDHSVKIGGSTYLPMDDQVRLSDQLNHICKIARKIHDPHEQSFFLLVHIAYLQAFTDVNKRTARLSANIPLIQHNLYPISFNQVGKDDYISAMIAIYELNNPSMLAELYTYSCLYTAKEYTVLVPSLGFNEARIRFRKELRNIVRDIILMNLSRKLADRHIKEVVKKFIPIEYQLECITLLKEDLKNIGPERIHGLGITQQELNVWMQQKNNEEK